MERGSRPRIARAASCSTRRRTWILGGCGRGAGASRSDRHHLRFIVSPEAGKRLDIKEFARELVREMQTDLGVLVPASKLQPLIQTAIEIPQPLVPLRERLA